MRNAPLSPESRYIPYFLLFSFILRAVGPILSKFYLSLLLFCSLQYIFEILYCSYSSVCPVGTTVNLIFYLILLVLGSPVSRLQKNRDRTRPRLPRTGNSQDSKTATAVRSSVSQDFGNFKTEKRPV